MKPAALLLLAGLFFCALIRPALAADSTVSPAALRAIPLRTIDGVATSLNNWQNKVLLIVNVASRCGNTPQYTALEALHNKYRNQGFSVLGFPCNDFGGQEPGTEKEIKAFCTATYRVTFPLFEKIQVKGDQQHPLYAAFTGNSSPHPGPVKWNFGKFLIARDGTILKRWDPETLPNAAEVTAAIEAALKPKPSAPATAPVRSVTFFGLPSSGGNVIFCLNTGGAVGTLAGVEGVPAIRREFKTTLMAMPPEMKFNIICFHADGDIFKPESILATDDAKNEALLFFQGYYRGTDAFGRTRTEKFGRAGKDPAGIAYIPLLAEDIKELEPAEGANRIDLAMTAAFHRGATTIFLLSDTVPGPKKKGTNVPIKPDDLILSIQNAWKKICGENAKLVVHAASVYSETPDKETGRFLAKLTARFMGKHRTVKPPKKP